MLSRSGLSIRKLIPHQRSSDEDLSGSETKKEDIISNTWTGQNGSTRFSSRKKRVPAPIIATSSLTHSDILRPLPPLPSETPRSSASSSCRCEHHIDCDCPLLSWKRRSPVSSIPFGEGVEESSSLLLSSASRSSSPDDTLVHHLSRSTFTSSDSRPHKEESTRSLSPEEDKEKMPKDWHNWESSSPEVSENVQRFMQEAEDAFKPIGSNLSKVHVTRPPVTSITKASTQRIPRDIEPTPPTPPPKEIRQSSSKSPPAKIMTMLGSSPPATPPKNTSPKNTSPIQRPKRKKSSKKSKTRSMRATRKPTPPKQTVKSGPRWTLTENVSELLTGKLFHRIEADEMLTPAQIEAFKQQRIRKLYDTSEVPKNKIRDVPIAQPSRNSALPSRLETVGANVLPARNNAESMMKENPIPPVFSDAVSRSVSPEEQQQSRISASPPRIHFAPHKNNASPKVAIRHVRKSSRNLKTELPIIPEANTTPRPTGDLYSSNESSDSLSTQSTSEYIYLKSSTYSLNNPAFQHGPIRISRSDLLPDIKLGSDDGLDWTAFQMAILGGAGDYFMNDYSRPVTDEADDAADIAEWWDSFNFESTGKLVTRDASSAASTPSRDEIPDLSYSEAESDNQSTQDTRWRRARHDVHASGLQLQTGYVEKKKHSPSHSLTSTRDSLDESWREDIEQKQVVTNLESTNSLPPSPMLDLRVIRSANGDDLDVVPMGYNLGHDLGDFLKWEAEYAYAGDFSSPI